MMARQVFVVLGMGVWLAACQAPTTMRPELTPEEVHAEEQAQQQMVDEIKAQGGTKKNWRSRPGMRRQFEEVAGRIEDAGADICRELDLPQQGRSCYYYFKISNKEELNAYADGKNIVVTVAMLRFLQNDDELAAILGHEMAHNLMAHLEASKKNSMAGGLVGLLIDGLAATQGINTQGEFMQAGMDVGHLSYSVEFEEEADYMGLYIMTRAGYNPRLAANVWRRMSLEFPDAIYNAQTHPSNASRFVAMQKTVSEIDYKRKHHVPLIPDFKEDAKTAGL